jgi:hypothetical protein
MAKSKFDTSFNFGANTGRKTKSKGKGGKRRLSAAQKYTAAMYVKPRRR